MNANQLRFTFIRHFLTLTIHGKQKAISMIHVFIERHIADDMISTYQDCSTKALKQTFQQAGFISADAYTDTDNPNHKFVVSQWRSKHDWAQWTKTQDRLDFINTISPMLSQPESVSILALEK